MRLASSLAIAAAGLIGAAAPAIFVQAAGPATLTIFAAGTLAVPFKQATALYEKQKPGRDRAGAVRRQRENGEADLRPASGRRYHRGRRLQRHSEISVRRAAARVWYTGFARNAITFVYTDKSKSAPRIDATIGTVLARSGVEIGRSDPDTDPSGYQTVQMLDLAEKYYRAPDLAGSVLATRRRPICATPRPR